MDRNRLIRVQRGSYILTSRKNNCINRKSNKIQNNKKLSNHSRILLYGITIIRRLINNQRKVIRRKVVIITKMNLISVVIQMNKKKRKGKKS